MRIDARIPVRFGPIEARRPDEALLSDHLEASPPSARFAAEPPSHAPGCACCVARSDAALALAGLFRARAVSAGPAFAGVLVVADAQGEALVRHALAADPFVVGRFRPADHS